MTLGRTQVDYTLGGPGRVVYAGLNFMFNQTGPTYAMLIKTLWIFGLT